MPVFEKRTRIAAPPEAVFAFHERPDALSQLMPPWEKARIIERTGGLETGARTVLEAQIGPVKQRMVAVHTAYEKGRMFQDTMMEGPFARWVHTHLMEPDGAGGTWLIDRIEYELPLGLLGRIGGGWFARRKIERMFAFRHEVTKKACEPA
ncbi:SRPBCC family protein [Polyangium aurulentum]|uniref:SRPBCC family protein n=1 Tax=Polyangium aurulentum TaxID=2567896 RepID=UPI0010AEC203|nr:SRPBCC family protein [Polyangium aurulentum]UQA55224.1 SRPBCC family protein [Polyangium aurulentum]